jgi:hypothetical protein
VKRRPADGLRLSAGIIVKTTEKKMRRYIRDFIGEISPKDSDDKFLVHYRHDGSYEIAKRIDDDEEKLLEVVGEEDFEKRFGKVKK